jgi:hypothetical protein
METQTNSQEGQSNEPLSCRDMSRAALAHAVRGAIKAAKKSGMIPKEWKLTVACDYAGYTKRVRVKISNYRSHGETVDLLSQREWERRLSPIVNEWNYNNSQIEVDHFDVGYYTHFRWM